MLIVKLLNILDLLTHLNKRHILQYNLYFANQTSKQSKKKQLCTNSISWNDIRTTALNIQDGAWPVCISSDMRPTIAGTQPILQTPEILSLNFLEIKTVFNEHVWPSRGQLASIFLKHVPVPAGCSPFLRGQDLVIREISRDAERLALQLKMALDR